MQYTTYGAGIFLCASLTLFAACNFLEDDPGVQVVRYTGPQLEADRTPKWTILKGANEGELTLTYTQMPIDRDSSDDVDYAGVNIGQTVFLTLSNGSGELPQFKDLWVGVVGGSGRTLVSGEIRLQDWNPDSVASGVIHGKLTGAVPFSTAFWVESIQTE